MEKYQKELTEVLTEYKRLKDESHSSDVNYPEISESGIAKLKGANAIAKEMLEIYNEDAVRETSEQAYQDAGLSLKKKSNFKLTTNKKLWTNNY